MESDIDPSARQPLYIIVDKMIKNGSSEEAIRRMIKGKIKKLKESE